MRNFLFGLATMLSLGLSAQDMELHLNNGQTITYGLQTVDRLMHNNGNLKIHVQGQSPVSYLLTDIEYFNYKASTITNVLTTSTKQSIRVYPNPGKDVFTVDLLTTASATIELYDLQGKLLHSERLVSGSQQHRLALDLPSGLYILKVDQGQDRFVEKLRITK